VLNAGDTAFLMMCTAMVCLMTPALAFFYGGLANSFTDALPTLGRKSIQFSEFSLRNLCARGSDAHFGSLAFAERIRWIC
jgi:hypothetical protein